MTTQSSSSSTATTYPSLIATRTELMHRFRQCGINPVNLLELPSAVIFGVNFRFFYLHGTKAGFNSKTTSFNSKSKGKINRLYTGFFWVINKAVMENVFEPDWSGQTVVVLFTKKKAPNLVNEMIGETTAHLATVTLTYQEVCLPTITASSSNAQSIPYTLGYKPTFSSDMYSHAVIAHELGHLFHYLHRNRDLSDLANGDQPSGTVPQAVKQMLTLSHPNVDQTQIEKLKNAFLDSTVQPRLMYAFKNCAEFVAEIFTLRLLTKEVISPDILNLYRYLEGPGPF